MSNFLKKILEILFQVNRSSISKLYKLFFLFSTCISLVSFELSVSLETFVARRSANLLNFDEDSVTVAIVIDGLQVLHVATVLAFTPKPPTASAPVAHSARL